ncbi:hypothetical protein [Taklimakanibacter lacteus]|uniref:hypothetical protein n=1 Tax=Taklimakanibacter lacteus TaxID=2268456 RepID=UPI000E66EFB2
MAAFSATRHLHVTFFLNPIENPAKSRAEGRPIFEDREMVEIKFVGDPKKILVAPAHEKFARDHASGQWVTYAQAYHRHYEAFKTGEAAKGEGTPIDELPFISSARRAELRALHVHTAEALSGLEGANLERLGLFGRELKDQAKAYIDKAKDSAVETKLAAENSALRQRIEALEAKAGEKKAAEPDWQEKEDQKRREFEKRQTHLNQGAEGGDAAAKVEEPEKPVEQEQAA